LRGVSLDIQAGEFVAIVGASGSGKSTCMNLIGCLDQPTRGTYRLGDVDVAALSANERAAIRNRRIGFVFQNFNLLGRTTALENMDLFVRLRRERYVTIILVTHEPHIAEYTQRVVTFRDGRIVSDLPRAASRHTLEIVRG